MNLVTVKSKFQVTIPAKLRKSINLQEGDLMEVIRVDDGILFRIKQVVNRTRLRKYLHHTLSAATMKNEGSIGL